jgi:hypothetical protein
MPTRVAILQSNYIPWRGYFDIMGLVDEFVIYDTVQFTKNDWRNRNKIKTAHGTQWLTIPVRTADRFGQSIAETQVADAQWPVKHWRSLTQAYARAPFLDAYRDRLAGAYDACGSAELLSDANRILIEALAAALGLATRILSAADYAVEGDRSGRLIALCRTLGATTYVSGPSARAYLDIPSFAAAGIEVEFIDYSGYGPYPQMHGTFEPAVSVIDLLLNVGPDATSYMRCGGLR